METGNSYEYTRRSVNAFTVKDPVTIGDKTYFVKIARLKDNSVDSIIDDATNNVYLNSVVDKPRRWTITLEDVIPCSIDTIRKQFTLIPVDEPSDHVSLWYNYVAAQTQPMADPYTFAAVVDKFREVLQTIVDAADSYGFVHNDLHLHNILFDTEKFVVIDYGRVVFTQQIDKPDSDLENTITNVLRTNGMIPNKRSYDFYPPKTNMWSPVRNGDKHVWVSDLVTLTMQLAYRLAKSTEMPFLSYYPNEKMFIPVDDDFDDPVYMMENTPRFLKTLLPGLYIYGIVLRTAWNPDSPYPKCFEDCFHPNFAMKAHGWQCFNDCIDANNDGELQHLSRAFAEAGLESDLTGQATHIGGADVEVDDVPPEFLNKFIDLFPKDLWQAAEMKDEYYKSLAQETPDNEYVSNMGHAYMPQPIAVGGGGNWVGNIVLACVVAVMALIPR